MKCALVTGCAGFIGSRLSESLIGDGWRVRGVDAFTPYYGRADKEANVSGLASEPRFDLHEADLVDTALGPLVHDVDIVFHLAAQPGVRKSFGEGFADYVHHNVLATQRLLEAARDMGVRRVVWASSSSVYGDAETYPAREASTPTRPRSPYGATKRAGEDLAAIYRALGLSVVGLRYFTVYGPRQRPDMAMRRMCEAIVTGDRFTMYGDGLQSRDFTYVDDAVDATRRAAEAAHPSLIYNVGGGQEATLREVIAIIERLAGATLALDAVDEQPGDVRRTGGDIGMARADLGWAPHTPLHEGLARELDWIMRRHRPPEPRRERAT